MSFQMINLRERLVAQLTHVGLLAGMSSHVPLEMVSL